MLELLESASKLSKRPTRSRNLLVAFVCTLIGFAVVGGIASKMLRSRAFSEAGVKNEAYRVTSPDGAYDLVVTYHGGSGVLDEGTTCLSLCRHGGSIDDAIDQVILDQVNAAPKWNKSRSVVVYYRHELGSLPTMIGPVSIQWVSVEAMMNGMVPVLENR